jgi:uncharacterized protein YkwD
VTRLAKQLVLAAIAACTAICAPTAAGAAGAASSSYDTPRVTGAHAARVRGRRADTHRVRTHKTSTRRTTTTRRSTPRKAPARRPTPVSRAKVQASAAEVARNEPVAIAKILATPCQNTGLTPEPANLALIRTAVLCLINTERAQNGREPLQANARLEAAAESHGKEMVAANYFDHVSPSGLTPVQRVRQTGYIPSSEVGYVIGENLAWGTLTLSTPAAIVAAWIASPEHLANVLEAKYQDTGIDVEAELPASLAEGVQGALYTQEFGIVIH